MDALNRTIAYAEFRDGKFYGTYDWFSLDAICQTILVVAMYIAIPIMLMAIIWITKCMVQKWVSDAVKESVNERIEEHKEECKKKR